MGKSVDRDAFGIEERICSEYYNFFRMSMNYLFTTYHRQGLEKDSCNQILLGRIIRRRMRSWGYRGVVE
jgi:hypothetical protein